MIQDCDSSSKEALKCMHFLISVFHEGQKKKKKKEKERTVKYHSCKDI